MELKLLRFLEKEGPMTVRQAADGFGQEHGVVLTTVLQMMERLRKKGMLVREQVNGVWSYRAVQPGDEVLEGVVSDFVNRTLGGSIEPFALYLANKKDLTPTDIQRLREIVDQLAQREGKTDV